MEAPKHGGYRHGLKGGSVAVTAKLAPELVVWLDEQATASATTKSAVVAEIIEAARQRAASKARRAERRTKNEG